MRFELATATRIVFGSNTSAELAPLVAQLGKRVLWVTGKEASRAAPLAEQLSSRGLRLIHLSVEREPTVDVVISGVAQARRGRCEVVVSVGGGSAIDAGKAVAALLTNPGEPLDYLEVVGRAQPLERPSAPMVAVPTTAGTGAEVTRNAVLTSPEHRVKVSLRSSLMLPRLAVVDPVLTRSMPLGVTASTGLDALTQVLEPFVSRAANPLTDSICREGLRRAARSLKRAFERGDDSSAREDMALVSLFGGLALANAKLGAVHGLAGSIGGMFPQAAHGVICARLLPHVMKANVQALQQRDAGSPAHRRYDEVARILIGEPSASSTDGIAWVQKLCQDLAVPSLADLGLTEADFPQLVDQASRSSSMKGNPIQLTADELTHVLRRAVGG